MTAPHDPTTGEAPPQHRATFDREFQRAMRYVVQKLERRMAAECELKKHGSTPSRESAYANADLMLTGAIEQLGDTIYDALAPAVPPTTDGA